MSENDAQATGQGGQNLSQRALTMAHIQKILDEAGGESVQAHQELGRLMPVGAATPGGAADILKSFPAMWPTIRPIILSVVGILKLFRRGDAAAGISTVVAYIDLVLGGAMPGPVSPAAGR